jgi:hypothetical protein
MMTYLFSSVLTLQCVGAACAPVYLFLVPSKDPRPTLSWSSTRRIKDIDMLGFTILVGCFVTLLMGINFGGLLYAWNSATIIALFALAGVLSVVFWIQQIWAIGTSKASRSFPIPFLVSHFHIAVNSNSQAQRHVGGEFRQSDMLRYSMLPHHLLYTTVLSILPSGFGIGGSSAASPLHDFPRGHGYW